MLTRHILAITLCGALASVSVAFRKARKAEHVPSASRARQVHQVPMDFLRMFFVPPSCHKTSCLWTLAQDFFELLDGDVAALGLGRCTWAHCGFGKYCLLWSRQDTHLPCLSLGFCLTTMRLLRRFRRAGSSGGEWPLPPGRHRPIRLLGRRLRRCAWVLLRGADICAAGHLLGSSQDTRHKLAVSSVSGDALL